MSDYVKSTDFASKDTLPSGDSAKIVRGTEIDAEFEALEVAIATKANTSDVASTYAPLNSPTFTGSPVLPTGTTAVTQAAGDNDTSVATTAFVTTAVGALGYPSFKNRIINGAMMIDQRNAGAAATVNTGARVFGVDRFFGFGEAADGVFTITQDSSAPAGFTNSTKITVTTADASVGAGQYYLFGHSIEGYNVADLGFGAAGASTVTLSFWVRSSLTGTFGGSLGNNGNARSYPFTYTINAANTWEQKSVTIVGDTSGTWLKTNLIGFNIFWDLGCGSSNLGTANAWASAAYFGVTGDTKLISTLNATLYITGVQLEKGSTATSFDYRPYGTELALCQRYAQPFGYGATGRTASATNIELTDNFKVTMRAGPTLYFGGFSGAGTVMGQFGVGNVTATAIGSYNAGPNGWYTNVTVSGATAGSIAGSLSADFGFAVSEL